MGDSLIEVMILASIFQDEEGENTCALITVKKKKTSYK
jgi:hypothetical protein